MVRWVMDGQTDTKKLTDGGFGVLSRVKLHHTGASRAPVRLVLDFCTFDLANSAE